MPVRRRAPNSKLTPALVEQLCAHLQQGQPKRAAAALVGIHRATLHRWEERGRDVRARVEEGHAVKADDRIYARFIDDLEHALDVGEGWLMQQALKAASGEIKARATDFVMLLERTRPDQWRRRSSAEYAEKPQPPRPRLDVSKLDRDERARLKELLQKARDGDE